MTLLLQGLSQSARHNQWMNERCLARIAHLTEAERRRDRGAFFGSIHSTFEHILWADRCCLARLRGPSASIPPVGTERHATFDSFREERAATDARILRWMDQIDEAWLAGDLVYTSSVDGRDRRIGRSLLLLHMFNHQIHHRGQVTTLLWQMGIDVGTTDLPFMPGFEIAAEV